MLESMAIWLVVFLIGLMILLIWFAGRLGKTPTLKSNKQFNKRLYDIAEKDEYDRQEKAERRARRKKK
jgi:hypothetical protein